MLAEQHGIIIQYIAVTEEHALDRDDFQQKYTDQVKVVALSMCSNITGTLINAQKAKKFLSEDTLLIIDGAQIVGKRSVDVKDIGCDIFIATAHKLYAMS
jgi:cysteine desulfurase/selenocysteine lyase